MPVDHPKPALRALSIRQPWAEAIMAGRKSIELRGWTTSYRGALMIHAGKTRPHTTARNRADASLFRGGYIGLVDLVEITLLDARDWDHYRSQHLAEGAWPGPTHGWFLANPRRFATPVPAKGKLGLYIVPVALLDLLPMPIINA
jgi:hypothetical protein